MKNNLKILKSLCVFTIILVLMFCVSCKLDKNSKKPANQIIPEKPEQKPVLELKELKVGKTTFTDLSSSKLLNADSVENETEKVKVVAKADSDVEITYTPQLDSEGFWPLTQVGENTLEIKLTRSNEAPIVYTIKLLRHEKANGDVFNNITAIRSAFVEYSTEFPANFQSYSEASIQNENGKKYCILNGSIDPQDYLGFIFVLKDGCEIDKVEQKSMGATNYVKIYNTKDEIVKENTPKPYRVYYLAKYSFSKGRAEEASIKITYKDKKEDEFIIKAKDGISE